MGYPVYCEDEIEISASICPTPPDSVAMISSNAQPANDFNINDVLQGEQR